jgi:hypothetical protein
LETGEVIVYALAVTCDPEAPYPVCGLNIVFTGIETALAVCGAVAASKAIAA